jgi:hypothetical protein
LHFIPKIVKEKTQTQMPVTQATPEMLIIWPNESAKAKLAIAKIGGIMACLKPE